jgi:hypothetical protein
MPRGCLEHANGGEGRQVAHGQMISPAYHLRRPLCWRASVLRRIFHMVQRRSRNMNADFESNVYAHHHQNLSHGIRRLIRRTLVGLARLQRRQFAAPWHGAPRRCAD